MNNFVLMKSFPKRSLKFQTFVGKFCHLERDALVSVCKIYLRGRSVACRRHKGGFSLRQTRDRLAMVVQIRGWFTLCPELPNPRVGSLQRQTCSSEVLGKYSTGRELPAISYQQKTPKRVVTKSNVASNKAVPPQAGMFSNPSNNQKVP